MQLVDNDEFFKRLGALFDSSKEHGSIWLTHKRLTHDDADAPMLDADAADEYPCLVRATDGNETKFSTRVQPGELEKFHSAYASLLRASMGTLRKRDKKREKQRAEEAATRKKKRDQTIMVDGPKRGAGRKKRQRKVKAAQRQEEARVRISEREDKAAKAAKV
ncbi:signal recognition particle, SRP9/SRP14 subunit [Peniophora sp. CONT]|nr:signal recognition particle, SRP9/SRP14 subunit [Peniophora sp. CONT]